MRGDAELNDLGGTGDVRELGRRTGLCVVAEPDAVVDRGHGVEADVRRTTVEGIVDTGVVSVVMPEEVASELGLRNWGTENRGLRRRSGEWNAR